jgi:glyoxylase-like metal-dependent hydrolase (beta-lactamase superfamily II)
METRSSQDRVHRLTFDVEWPPGHVACYLVAGPEPILVDAGAPGKTDALRSVLGEYGYSIGDIDHLVVTHPHVDHVGGVPTIVETANPTVHAPIGLETRFAKSRDGLKTRVRRNCRAAGFSGDSLESVTERAVEPLERNVELLPPESVDVWMEPGKSVSVGHLEFEGVHLPGHQADHLSYRTEIAGDRALLSGDMGIESFRPIVLHDRLDDGYRDAFGAFYRALDRMVTLDVDLVYPGHGPVHDDLPGAIERDRASLDARLDRIAELVADGHATAATVAETIAGGHESQYLVPEAMGALAYLEERGRITSESLDGVRRYSA